MILNVKHLVYALLLCIASPVTAQRVLITGEVRAEITEPIIVPPSDAGPVVLRYYVPDGAEVQAGDVLVRIDPGQSLAQLRQLEAQIDQTQARVDKDIAELQVQAIDAEKTMVDAEAAYEKARVDAAIPRIHLSALDYDRYQGELQRAERELALKRDELAAAEQAIQRRREDAELELNKFRAERVYHELRVRQAELRAEHTGTVVHGFDPLYGERYDEGSQVLPGHVIGEVLGGNGSAVRGYALEPDRLMLRVGQAVALSFDALPDTTVNGRIERISGAPEPKAGWGEGRYFALDIAMEDADRLPLKPGMSVRIAAETVPLVPLAQGRDSLRYQWHLRITSTLARRSDKARPAPPLDARGSENIRLELASGSIADRNIP